MQIDREWLVMRIGVAMLGAVALFAAVTEPGS